MQERLAEAPKKDWRSSLMWEALAQAEMRLNYDMFEAAEDHKPADYRHWSEKYDTSTSADEL
jgi:hypothetical protein